MPLTYDNIRFFNTLKPSQNEQRHSGINDAQSTEDREICNILSQEISRNMPEAENKIWHTHPVWFLNGVLERLK